MGPKRRHNSKAFHNYFFCSVSIYEYVLVDLGWFYVPGGLFYADRVQASHTIQCICWRFIVSILKFIILCSWADCLRDGIFGGSARFDDEWNWIKWENFVVFFCIGFIRGGWVCVEPRGWVVAARLWFRVRQPEKKETIAFPGWMMTQSWCVKRNCYLIVFCDKCAEKSFIQS